MTTVYYNFPEISLSLQGIESSSSQEIQIASVGQPLTNVQINNVNYTAYSLIITSSSSPKNPGYLIIKCHADVNDTTSNLVYFAIPLVVSPPNEANKSSSDVDNIINAKTNKSDAVKLNLNNYIKNGGSCVIPPSTSFPLTITLDSTSAIPIQQYVNTKFYNIGNIPSLAIDSNPNNNKNATLQQQDLDWVMSCELLTEDGPVEKTQVELGTTATTISLFMMAIMIAGTAYIVSPTIYQELGMYKLATTLLGGNHFSINAYWGITLVTLAIMCIINGVSSNNTTFYFIGIGFILSYFSATSAILKVSGIANSERTGFDVDSNTSAFQVYYELFSRNCYSGFGFGLKMLSFILFAYTFFAMIGFIASKNNYLFSIHLFLFIIFAVLQLIAILKFNKITNST